MSIDPVTYQSVLENVGFFDASHIHGRLFAKGKDAIDLLHRMSTNDLKPLEESAGRVAVTVLPNEKGRIVDVLTVIRDDQGDVMLVTSAGREEAVVQWLDKFTIMEDARFVPASDIVAQFALYGPLATELLSSYTAEELNGLSIYSALRVLIGTVPATIMMTSPVAGCGWWIFTGSGHAEAVRTELEARTLAIGGAVVTDELNDLLRIESGVPKAPNELNDKHNPLEMVLTQAAVSFTKGCYIGQEVIARLDAQGKVQRQLVGLRFTDGMPSVGDRISDPSLTAASPLGDEIGDVTSVAVSPVLGPIGLGYVRARHSNPGGVVSVKDTNGNSISATIVTLPFET